MAFGTGLSPPEIVIRRKLGGGQQRPKGPAKLWVVGQTPGTVSILRTFTPDVGVLRFKGTITNNFYLPQVSSPLVGKLWTKGYDPGNPARREIPLVGKLRTKGYSPSCGMIDFPAAGKYWFKGALPYALNLVQTNTPDTGKLWTRGWGPEVLVGRIEYPDAGRLIFAGRTPDVFASIRTEEPGAGTLRFIGTPPYAFNLWSTRTADTGVDWFAGRTPDVFAFQRILSPNSGVMTWDGRDPLTFNFPVTNAPLEGKLWTCGRVPLVQNFPFTDTPAEGKLWTKGADPLELFFPRTETPVRGRFEIDGRAPAVFNFPFTDTPNVGKLWTKGYPVSYSMVLDSSETGVFVTKGASPLAHWWQRPSLGVLRTKGYAPGNLARREIPLSGKLRVVGKTPDFSTFGEAEFVTKTALVGKLRSIGYRPGNLRRHGVWLNSYQPSGSNYTIGYSIGTKIIAPTGKVTAIRYLHANVSSATFGQNPVFKVWAQATSATLAVISAPTNQSSGWIRVPLAADLTITATKTIVASYNGSITDSQIFGSYWSSITFPVTLGGITGVQGLYGSGNVMPATNEPGEAYFIDIEMLYEL